MKKKLTIIMSISIPLFIASCKKDYTCTCKDSKGQVLSTYTIHDTKRKAKEACDYTSSQTNWFGATCTLN